jgi:hypothetical protein
MMLICTSVLPDSIISQLLCCRGVKLWVLQKPKPRERCYLRGLERRDKLSEL